MAPEPRRPAAAQVTARGSPHVASIPHVGPGFTRLTRANAPKGEVGAGVSPKRKWYGIYCHPRLTRDEYAGHQQFSPTCLQ